jgi:hypothetical protein
MIRRANGVGRGFDNNGIAEEPDALGVMVIGPEVGIQNGSQR